MRKSILFVELRRLEIRGTFDGTELAFDRAFTAYHGRQYTVERHFHKLTDFTFPSDDHAKHTGHHTSD